MTHELQQSPESISQQFITYVTSHSDALPDERYPETLREGSWNVHVNLPLLPATVEQVRFGEYFFEGGDGSKTHRYDIQICMNDGMDAWFTHEPLEPNAPFTFYWGETPFLYEVQDEDVTRLLAELTGYEVSGQMTKADVQSE